MIKCSNEDCIAKARKDSSKCRLHTKCIDDGCESTIYAKGWCYNHYQTQYRGTTNSKPRCMADGCKRDPWRGKRQLDDGKMYEVRHIYDDKQYCAQHRPQGVMPKELFLKEWIEGTD